MLGLVKGTVELYEHEKEWEDNAKIIIENLKEIFGSAAVDIQHVGSTAIVHIKAKPIIDISVGVKDFDKVRKLLPYLETQGLIHRPNNDLPDYMMFVMGNMEKEIRTHHIHVMQYNGEEWHNQINFRDYLNTNSEIAKEYEALKLRLMEENRFNRSAYTSGKQDFIMDTFRKAATWASCQQIQANNDYTKC